MAVDMFLKIDKIDGEAVDHKHAKEIDVLAWSWGMSQSGTTHNSEGSGAGKVNVQDISITKYVDRATPTIMQHISQGKHITEATLVVRKAGEKPLEYITIKMTDVIITSLSTGGSGGEDRLTENITLNFAKVTYEYDPQDKKGGGKGKIPYNFDIALNEAF
jgi:type VI secretion system secreted protein Hcp